MARVDIKSSHEIWSGCVEGSKIGYSGYTSVREGAQEKYDLPPDRSKTYGSKMRRFCAVAHEISINLTGSRVACSTIYGLRRYN